MSHLKTGWNQEIANLLHPSKSLIIHSVCQEEEEDEEVKVQERGSSQRFAPDIYNCQTTVKTQ